MSPRPSPPSKPSKHFVAVRSIWSYGSHLPGASGIDFIRQLRQVETPPAVVLITGEGSVTSAVEALKLGATDYLQKPIDPMRLVTLVQELLRSDDVREAGDNEHLPSRPTVFEGMVGGSQRMREVFARIERVAPTGAPVLMVGESGTGKELVARGLHNRSRRAQGPFVPIHTGAIPKELVASELFGHEKGAFTGALSSAEGKFEAAAGGHDFPRRGRHDGLCRRRSASCACSRPTGSPGSARTRSATPTCASSPPPTAIFSTSSKRTSSARTSTTGSTSSRSPSRRFASAAEDIVPIAERFLRFFAQALRTPAPRLSDKALERLLGHEWPGNVRELRNVMEQTAVFAQREVVHADEIQFISTRLPTHQKGRGERTASSPQFVAPSAPHHDMPAPAPEPMSEAIASSPTPPPIDVTPTPMSPVSTGPVSSTPASYTPTPATVEVVSARPSPAGGDEHPLVLRIPVGTPLAEAERMLIIKTLEVSDGNKQRAARILGISRRGLYTKLAAYGEHVPADEAADNGVAGAENGVNAGETVNGNGNGEHGEPPTPNA